jgi:hypothetical protein
MESEVRLSLDQYENLKKYEREANLPKKHTVVIRDNMFCKYVVETNDDAVKLLSEDLKKSYNEKDELRNERDELRTERDKLRQNFVDSGKKEKPLTIEDIKKMSVLNFYLWKIKQ